MRRDDGIPDWRVRPFRDRDADDLSRIYRDAVEQIGARCYSADQVRAWASVAPSPAEIARRYRDGRHAFVAVDADDRPIGFCDVECDGHVDLLYVDPGAAGRGVGSGLLRHVQDTARDLGIERLFAEASESALPVFVRCGFTEVRRRDFELAGVGIHNYAVELLLTR